MTQSPPDRPPLTEKELNALFEAFHEESPEPSGAAMASWVASAEAAALEHGAHLQTSRTPRKGWLAETFALIGGWRAGVGLVTATMAGIWIGVNPPDLVLPLIEAGVNDSYLVGFAPDFDALDQWEGL